MIDKTIPRPRLVLRAVTAASVAVVALGCEGITNSVETAELAGFWVASELRFANAADLNQTVDGIRDRGYTLTLEVSSAGAYVRVLTPPGADPDSAFGTLNVENGKDITMTDDNGIAATGEVFLEDDQVALLFDESQGLELPLDGSGKPVPVTILAVMDRQ
jgi:hypothetical protein